MSVVEVMSSIIGDSLVQLLTEQSNLYHSNNAEKWKILLNNITTKETGKFLGLTILMEQVRKEYKRDCWSTDPTISTPIFPHTISRNHFESTWQAWNFIDKHQIQGSCSNFGPYMNIL
jgi:hypothetical protein